MLRSSVEAATEAPADEPVATVTLPTGDRVEVPRFAVPPPTFAAEGRVEAMPMYAGTAEAENYLRGVLETDAEGRCTFTTVFPGCYPGRWPHVHFEVFDSLAAATSGGASKRISQLAFPEDSCDAVYATAGYETSAEAVAPLSIATDGVFADGAADQIATVTAEGAGYAASLRVAV